MVAPMMERHMEKIYNLVHFEVPFDECTVIIVRQSEHIGQGGPNRGASQS